MYLVSNNVQCHLSTDLYQCILDANCFLFPVHFCGLVL